MGDRAKKISKKNLITFLPKRASPCNVVQWASLSGRGRANGHWADTPSVTNEASLDRPKEKAWVLVSGILASSPCLEAEGRVTLTELALGVRAPRCLFYLLRHYINIILIVIITINIIIIVVAAYL